MQQIFSRRPPQTLGVGSKFNLSEYGHVAYNILWVCPMLPPLHDPGGSENMVMLLIKLNGITNAATSEYSTPPPRVKWSKFSEHGHVVYQNKGNDAYSSMVANILLADPWPWDGVNRSNFNFSEHGHATYQIKGNDTCSNMVANIFYRQAMQAHILALYLYSTQAPNPTN